MRESLKDSTQIFLEEKSVPIFRPPHHDKATLENLVGFSEGLKQLLIRPIISRIVRSKKERTDLSPLSYTFMGPPGTGKSVTCRMLANTLGTSMRTLNLDQILTKYVGEAETNFKEFLSESFSQATFCQPKPLIIRVEEAEILLRSKKDFFGQNNDCGYRDLLPILLSHLSGDYMSNQHKSIFLLWIFTVNEIDVVGRAIKSRSIPFNFPLPDSEVATKLFIFGSLGKGYPVKDFRDIDWEWLGKIASQEGLSHREIMRACEVAKARGILHELKRTNGDIDIYEIARNLDLCMSIKNDYQIREKDLKEGLQEVVQQKVQSN